MPIVICLKNPPGLTLVTEGDIGENAAEKYDEMFAPQGALMLKTKGGQNIVVPIGEETNIAYMREITDTEIEEQKLKQKQGQGKNLIQTPGISFPGGGGKRRH